MVKRSMLIALTLMIIGCGVSQRNPDDILQSFRTAGVATADPIAMERVDYGAAPMLCQAGARRFLIPSMGADKGGRLFVCENVDDANKSWTYQNETVLLQLNGQLDKTQAKRYGQIIAALP